MPQDQRDALIGRLMNMTPAQRQELLKQMLAQLQPQGQQQSQDQDGACSSRCNWMSGPDSPGTTGFCYSAAAANQCSAAKGSNYPAANVCAGGQKCCCLAAGLPTPSNIVR